MDGMRDATAAGQAFRRRLERLPVDWQTLGEMLACVDDILTALEELRAENGGLVQTEADAALPAV